MFLTIKKIAAPFIPRKPGGEQGVFLLQGKLDFIVLLFQITDCKLVFGRVGRVGRDGQLMEWSERISC